MRPLLGGLLLATTTAITGCTTVAPSYQPDFGSVNTLKNYNLTQMQASQVNMADPKLEKVTIRGGSMKSPYGNSYAGYYRFAIDEQLKQARLFDSNSPIAISCLVTRNDLDGSGSSIGTADLAATFTVTKTGKDVFKKPISIHHEWPSSFIGATAIPNAVNGYGAAVQKLVSAFFADPEFIEAVKK